MLLPSRAATRDAPAAAAATEPCIARGHWFKVCGHGGNPRPWHRLCSMPCVILRAVTALVLLLVPVYASAQELEPGAYWPIPTG